MAIRKPGKIDVNDILLPDDEPSLLFIQRELARTNGINFEQWWDEFKKGFIGGKRDKNSNFPTSLWTNPKYTNLTPPDSTSGAMTIEYWPDKSIATESYLLSGTVANLITGVMTIMLNKSFRPVDFDTWFKGWSEGFIDFKENRTASNYPLEKTAWRAKPENRPRFREWSKPTQRSINGRIIEYWKDRSIQGESIILSGSDSDLIRHVLQVEYEGGGSNSGNIAGKNSKPLLKGWPAIILTFYEPNDSVRRKPTGEPRSRVEGEKTIRCSGYTDDTELAQRGLAKLIENGDIRRWATKIRDEFALPELYRWEKGRECLSYSGQVARLQGLEGYALVRTARQGKEIFEKLLRVFDFTPDPTGFKYSINEIPEIAFPENPPNFQLLGKKWEAKTQRPSATVVFDSAVLYLPKFRSPIPLVKGREVIYKA